MTYLVDHPTDFRGAFARVRRELRSLYFSAFQSHLWNLLLARLIERTTRPEQRVPIDFKVATLPIHRGLDPDQAAALAACRIPLPAVADPAARGPARATLALEVLAEHGLAWEDLRVKHLKDVFFSKGDRARAVLRREPRRTPSPPTSSTPAGKKLRLAFELPKGAYATLVVKRLTDAATSDPET